MKNLLEYILKGILGKEKFEIEEASEEGRETFIIHTKPENIGLVIGKSGKMINTIRNILKVKATLERKGVNIQVTD